MSDLSEKQPPIHVHLREEIRGIFVLGLLAVVASIRIQNKEITLTINENLYNITFFFDVMLIMWSLYAFFMVMGISDDIVGEAASNISRRISRQWLLFSFLVLGLMAIVFYYSIYPLRAIGLFVFVLASFIYWSAKQIYLLRKKTQEKGLSVKSLLQKSIGYLKTEWYQFFVAIFFTCFILVVLGARDEFILPSSIIGSIFLILFLLMRERRKHKDEDPIEKKVS